MPRVICDLPHASDEISGVKFHLLDDGRRISDEIEDEQAQRFASIPGYELDEEEREEDPPPPPPAPKAPKLTKAQQKAADKKAAEEAAAQRAAEETEAAEEEAARVAAEEEAARLAAEEASKQSGNDDNGNDPKPEEEVF